MIAAGESDTSPGEQPESASVVSIGIWDRFVVFWHQRGDEDNPSLDYAFLQKAIGLIALLLPLMVWVFKGALQHNWTLEASISHFYYTRGRNYFVGSLCALSVFFLSYHRGATGKYRLDNLLSDFASLMALGVAFCPTTKDSSASTAEKAVGVVHLSCAASLFIALGVFALFLFRQSSGPKSPQKRQRDGVYLACGLTIFACIAVVGLSELISVPKGWPALYWFETIMVEAFAIGWLVKGGFLGLLADTTPTRHDDPRPI
jgi:hypothetical protein